MRWQLLPNTELHSFADIDAALIARIPEKYREAFLSPPRPEDLPESWHGIDVAALKNAALLLKKAVTEKKKVVIFGDYDCDGVTATAILWETLYQMGLTARPFLPHREKHGYGLSIKALEEIFAAEKPDILITVDNGIVANEAFTWLKKQGVTTILTDHHEPNGEKPPADIIVHSTLLAGATVSWMLANALDPVFAQQELDLAALGTIADQVPLYGANRSFAFHGLQALRHSTRPSLVALAQLANTSLDQATENTVHYVIAPRINAMGRLYHALDALRALVSKNPKRIQELAQQLQSVNTERQQVTSDFYEQVESVVEQQKNEHLIVAVGPYHEGVIGLLASKLVDLTSKPSLVFSTLGELAKASGRSVPGVNLIRFLRSVPVEYAALGGHAMAAGLSVEKAKLQSIVNQLQQVARETIRPEDLTSSQPVLGNLDWSLFAPETVEHLKIYAPYGAGNEPPVFALSNFQVKRETPLGASGKHSKFWLVGPQGEDLTAICFESERKLGSDWQKSSGLAVRLQLSTYRAGLLETIIEGPLKS